MNVDKVVMLFHSSYTLYILIFRDLRPVLLSIRLCSRRLFFLEIQGNSGMTLVTVQGQV